MKNRKKNYVKIKFEQFFIKTIFLKCYYFPVFGLNIKFLIIFIKIYLIFS